VPFDHIRAQQPAVRTLTVALQGGRVHHAYRFEGPDGVGKELTAFALAQALTCTGGEALGCGRCDACRKAVTFNEGPPATPLAPDVIVVERGLYPAETIGRSRGELVDISVDQVRRVVLTHVGFAPHGGRARVFIIRRADELSISAGNALLKTLEEPRPDTHFVLLTSRPDRLLDTIRSRTMPIRFGPLPEALIREVLVQHQVPAERQDLAVELGAGSASAALEHADPEHTAARDAFVARVLAAASAPDLGAAVALAEAGPQDRAALRRDLVAVGAALARTARLAAGSDPRAAEIAAYRYDVVAQAIIRLEKNASTNLSLIQLVAEMRAGGLSVGQRWTRQ
jgi:DNA polymerase-3 subunit delta'